MFRTLYRTNQLTVDTKAATINILFEKLAEVDLQQEHAYKVVAFIVTVKLVDNNVNRNVGSVMVVNVITQNRMPGKTLIRNMIIRAKLHTQEPWTSICSMVVPLTRAAAEGIAEAIVLAKLSMAEETVPESDSIECWIVSAWAELTAMMTVQFSAFVEHISGAEAKCSLELENTASCMVESFWSWAKPSKGALSATVAEIWSVLALYPSWHSPPRPPKIRR
jgi:hypothetical protein